MLAGHVSDQARQDFDTSGFVAFREFVAGDALVELISNVERFIRDIVPTMSIDHVFYEDKSDRSTLKQLRRLGENDPWFHDLFHTGVSGDR